MPDARQFVDFRIDDRVAVVKVDRPPVNALNRQVEDEIEAVFKELGTLNEVGAVIVTGGGAKAFIAGADIKMISEKSPKEAFEMSTATQRVLSKIEKFDRVVIAAVNGLALGGGCEVALACDIRVADESAIFGFPEVSLGLLPGAGGTQRLARLVGIGKAKELILTGDPISADEAKRIGLVERIAPKGEAVAEATSLAKRVLLRGPIAVSNAKKAMNEGTDMTFEDGLRRETELFAALFETQDMKEGVRAFLEKRKPDFVRR
jgi:enoyl-CoA hydratase